jgi:hypothetical protein
MYWIGSGNDQMGYGKRLKQMRPKVIGLCRFCGSGWHGANQKISKCYSRLAWNALTWRIRRLWW